MGKVVKLEPTVDKEYKQYVNDFKFGLEKLKLVGEDGRVREFYFIALKHKMTNVTLELTPYSKYLRYCINSIDTRRPETIRIKGIFICMFLNYLFFEKYDVFKIKDIREITIEHGQRFLQDYALGHVGKKNYIKDIDTIGIAIRELARFYKYIQKVHKKEAGNLIGIEMLSVSEIINPNTGIKYNKYETPFNIVADDVAKEQIFRDIPNDVFWMLLNLSKIYYPEITLAIAIQAFAGLRAGEVCNVRQPHSPQKKGGVKLQKTGSKLTNFEIDITTKYPMRSDLVDVGSIKKPRKQNVYTKFIPIISKLYDSHMILLSQRGFEENYAPMFVNEDGLAMTNESYSKKFTRLVNNYLCPELLKSNNGELRLYGELLLQNTLGTHSLRHWFTVQLVLDSLPPHDIASWRGDDNINTALIYCSNKTELLKAYKKANETLFNNIINSWDKGEL